MPSRRAFTDGSLARGVLAAVIAGLLATPAAVAQNLTGLGLVPGGVYSHATAVSGDGTAVIGYSTMRGGGRAYAFRWTRLEGLVSLGPPPGGIGSHAYAVSTDGTTVAGTINSRAFRWTAKTGLVTLEGAEASYGLGMGDGGRMVVGSMASTDPCTPTAFRWTSAEGMISLGTLPGATSSHARGASADGSVIVGSSGVCDSGDRIFRWTAGTGMESIGWGRAFAVSADGAVVVGAGLAHPSHAFRWSADTGGQDLGTLPGAPFSKAFAVSGDGSVVVGSSGGNGPGSGDGRAFLWTAAQGMLDLNTFLPTLGIDLTGWELLVASGVSADARVIAGFGRHNGRTEAWVVNFDPPACPADFDYSGTIDSDDFFDFLQAFLNRAVSADFNRDGTIDSQDFFDFLEAFFSGC